MSKLAGVAIIAGCAISVVFAPCVVVPDRARAWIKGFPRSRPSALILAAGDLTWAALLLLNAPLGRFEGLKPLVYVLMPVVFLLVITLMDELLGPRALGGLLILAPAPLLDAARWEASGLRLVIVVLAYCLVFKGIILVLSPYQFRRAMAPWIRSNGLCRACGCLGLAFGIFVILLGVTLF